jgi:hypothetical protein
VNHKPELLILVGSLIAACFAMRLAEKKTAAPNSDRVQFGARAKFTTFVIGAHVQHPHFGHGTVVGTEGGGDHERLVIKFGSTIKKLHLKTAVDRGPKVTG